MEQEDVLDLYEDLVEDGEFNDAEDEKLIVIVWQDDDLDLHEYLDDDVEFNDDNELADAKEPIDILEQDDDLDFDKDHGENI